MQIHAEIMTATTKLRSSFDPPTTTQISGYRIVISNMTDGPHIQASPVISGENRSTSREMPDNYKETTLESLKPTISESEATAENAKACYASSQARMEHARAALRDAQTYHDTAKGAFDALSAGVPQQADGGFGQSNVQRSRQLFITQAKDRVDEALAELTSAKVYYNKCCTVAQIDRLTQQLASKQLETLLTYQKNLQDLKEDAPFQQHLMDGHRKTMRTGEPLLPQGTVNSVDKDTKASIFFGTVALDTADVPCAIISSGACWILHGGQQLPYEGEYQLLLYKGDVEWVAASLGMTPEGRTALRGGVEEDGTPWYHAKNSGGWPAKTGTHLVFLSRSLFHWITDIYFIGRC